MLKKFNYLLCAITVCMFMSNASAQSITVANPNGGETLYACEQYNITWSTSGTLSDYYNIDYSLDGGTIWASIATNYYSLSLDFLWTVPQVQSSSCLIRIKDAQNGTIVDQSDALFVINIPITVLSPNGGETFPGGSIQTITWNALGTSGVYDLFYSINGGSTWITIVANFATGTPTYNWSVPNTPSTNCLVKVRDDLTSCMIDQSDAAFTIAPLAPELLTPNGGEVWYAGCSNAITWDAATFYSTVRLDYSDDNGVTWNVITSSTANDGYETWVPPIGFSGTDYLIKASSTADLLLNDVSDAVFSIVPGIEVTSANGGEIWNGCSTYPITWNKPNACITKFRLYYSIDNGATWITINSYVNNIGSGTTQTYNWAAPNGINTTQALIKVVDYYDPAGNYDISDANFTITPSADVTVTSPNGGESLQANGTYMITWSNLPSASGSYNIQYSVNGGSSWSTIINNLIGNGYLWTVANNPSTNCLIKVIDAGNTCKFDVSDAVFTITPLIPELFIPNGFEQWAANCPHTITWDQTTFYTNVRLDYSDDNGATWNIITTNTSNDGNESWTPPIGLQGNNFIVRVSSTSNILINDISDTTFSIIAPITVVDANGGETWDACTTQTITWTKPNSCIIRFTPAYSVDGGATWTNMTTYVNNSGSGTTQSYNWSIPNGLNTNQAMIRVSDYYNASTVFDVSDAVFTIAPLPSGIAVTSPNGGEVLAPFGTHTITWTDSPSNSGSYHIYYSINGGASYSTIATNILGNSYVWTIPNNPSVTCKVKIRDASNSCKEDASDADFTITPIAPMLLTPNGGEQWFAGCLNTITWDPASYYTNLRLDYSTDGGATWNLIISNTSNDGTHDWTPPLGASGTNYLIKASSASDLLLFDISDAPFTVLQPITVTYANGGETFNGCATETITWTKPNACITRFIVYYSLDNGATWTAMSTYVNNIGSGTTQSYNWTVPNGINTSQALIKVEDYYNPLVSFDVSDANFTIAPSNDVTVTTPNGGEVLAATGSYTITWTNLPSASGLYNLQYSVNGGASWSTIVNGISGNAHLWTVPNNPSTNCLVKVIDAGNTCKYDVSDTVFTITPQDAVLLTPNGFEVWPAGCSHDITWNSATYYSSVRLDYSLDNGATWITIVSSTSNDGLYSWTPPAGLSGTSCRIKASSVSDLSHNDISDTTFTLIPPITVIDANGGETWNACSTATITWTKPNDCIIRFTPYYSLDNGVTWTSIVTYVNNIGTGTTQSYNWNIPSTFNSTQALIKIADYYSPSTNDESDAVFTIAPIGPITVTAPNGGETFNGCSQQSITWSKPSNCIAKFTPAYSIDNGATWINIVTYVNNIGTGNTQSYTWTVPNGISTSQALIRVENYDDVSSFDISDANFTIAPSNDITVTSPNGGELLPALGTHTLTWSNLPSASGLYNVQYSINGGSSWSTIINGVSGNAYVWSIPNNPSANCLIKVIDAVNTCTFDVSDLVFTIEPLTPLLLAPNGGESWATGCAHTITWDATTFYSNVRLDYSVDNGVTWFTIISNTSNDGSHSWTPPTGIYGANSLIKISSTANLLIYDVSDTTLAIIPEITVTSPNGGEVIDACSVHTITWDKPNNCINKFSLYYSIDNGATWSTITTYLSNSGSGTTQSYNWTVPSSINSNQALIKIVDYYNSGTILDISDSVFTIAPVGQISLIDPNGGELWNGCSTQAITWLKPNACITRFTPAYSLDNGGTWTNIVSYVNNIGTDTVQTYNWTVPTGINSSQVLIKVSDYYNPTTNLDSSDAVFTITSNDEITLTAPNGGEFIQGLSSYTIQWLNLPTTSGSYNLYYSINGGSTWISIITGVIGNNYFWSVPNTPSANCLIKIEDAGGTCKVDISDSLFTITPATPIMLYPNGGESLYASTNTTITWNASTYYSNVRIDYSTNNGFTWNLIDASTTNDGSYLWNIPNVSSTECLMRVSNVADLLVNDISDAVFEINPAVTIIAPNGDDGITNWGGCSVTSITFDHTPAYSQWNIRYSLNGGLTWITIVNNWSQSANPATYNWTIPNTSSSQVLVKVEPSLNTALYDVSDSTFTVDKPVTIIQPNFGGFMQVGSVYNIEWDSEGISNLYDLFFSNNGGATWSTIVIGFNTSLNTYPWTVPNSPSTNCLIRVRDNINTCKEDTSDVAFTISLTPPAMTVLSPNGGDTLSGCADYDITWTELSPNGTYDIAYSTDNGVSWIDIVTNYVTGVQSYAWTVPNLNSATVLTRVKATGTGISDLSDALFTILPNVLNIETNDTTICGGASVQLIASGTPDYLWSPAFSLSNVNIANPIATPTATTTYYVESTVGSCFLQDSITITALSVGIDTVAVDVVTSPSNIICSGTSVTLTATPTNGGTLPSYQWQVNGLNVGTNDSIYTNAALNDNDIVNVILTSNQSCVANPSDTSVVIAMDVSNSSVPTVAVAVGPSDTICAGTNVIFNASTTNGGSTPSYQWQVNGLNVGTDTNVYNSSTLANNDIVTVVLTSSSACAIGGPVTDSPITMVVNTIPAQPAVISGPANVCENSSASYSVVPDPVVDSYSWALPSGWTGLSTTDNINTLSGVAGGTITVSASNMCGNSAIQTFIVGLNSNPVVLANSTAMNLCSGDPVTLTGTGASSYSWDNGVTNGIAFNPTFTGTYNVTGTSINGCVGTDQITLTVSPLPSITANASTVDVCSGSSVLLTGSGGSTYSWDNGVTDGVSFTPVVSNTYTVTGTNINGCVNTDQITVNVHTPPSVQAGNNQSVCENELVTLSASGAVNYTWNNGITDNTPFTAISTNNFIVTGVDAFGCVNTDTVLVTVNLAPTVTATATTNSICIGNPVILNGGGASTYAWDFGVNNGVSFNPSSTNTYTVTGTDINGCTATDQVTVNVNALPTVVANSSSSSICPGGSVILTGAGASSYSWNNGALDGVPIFPAGTTTYTVTGTNANGCVATAQTMVTMNAIPNVQAGIDQTICENSMVTFSGSGASSYTWDNGISNNVAFAATSSATYIVTGTGVNGCIDTDTVNLTVNAAPVVIANASSNAICIGGAVTLTGSGASSYSWNYSVIDGAPFNPSGTLSYTVTGTAANGCVDTDVITVNVNPLPAVVANTSASGVCLGSSVTLTGSGAATYSWDNGVLNGTPIIPAGTTTYTVIGTDLNGCISTDQVTVSINSIPNVQAGNDQIVCENTSVSLIGSGAASYSWDNGITNNVPFAAATTTSYVVTGTGANGCVNTDTVNVFVNAAPNVIAATTANAICLGSSVTLTGSGANTYTWNFGVVDGNSFNPSGTSTYTVTGTDLSGCTATDQVMVTVNALPTVVGNTSASSICQGSSVILTGAGANSYIWDNGALNGTPIIPTATTTYTVTGTDANGCTNTDQVLVSFSTVPNVQAGIDQNVCGSSQITVSGSGATSYTWNNGVIDNTPFTATSTMTYIVTGTDALGCTNTDTMTVSVNSSPTVIANATANTVCIGNPITLSGSGANSYAWDFGVTDGVPLSPSNTLTYTVTGTDVNGCTDTDQVTITVNALPVVVANSTTMAICPGEAVILTGAGANSYVWDNSALDGVSISPVSTTTFTVTGTDINGCSNMAQAVVTVNPMPNVQAGIDQIVCETELVTLFGTGANSYLWNNGISDNTAFPAVTTTTYIVTGTNGFGCEDTDTVLVTVNSAPNVIASATTNTICTGESVTLTGSGASSYIWDFSVVNGVSFNPTNTQTYTVTGTGSNGCTATDQVSVTVNTAPTPTVSVSGSTLTTQFFTTYQWYLDGNPIPGATSQTYDFTQNGDYAVEVTNANGCSTLSSTFNVANVGISDEQLAQIKMFPNPSAGTLNIDFGSVNGTKLIRVVDIAGKMVYSEQTQELNLTLNLDAADGYYQVMVVSEDQKLYFNEKLILQK